MKDTLIAIGSLLVGVMLAVVLGFYAKESPAPSLVGGTEVRAPNVDTVTYNGVQTTYRRNGDTASYKGTGTLSTGTTTVCAIQSPVATSTLLMAYLKEDTSSTTASLITAAKAGTAFATTTSLATSTIAAGAQATIPVATTTPVADSVIGRLTLTDRVFGPSQWLVFGQSGGTGTFSPTGTCVAIWNSSAPNI